MTNTFSVYGSSPGPGRGPSGDPKPGPQTAKEMAVDRQVCTWIR